MRTHTVFIIVSLANLIVGAVSVLAYGQDSMSISWTLVGFAIAIGASVSGWGWLKLRKGLRLMATQPGSTNIPRQSTGLGELDTIGEQFADALRRNSAAVNEVAEMKELLAKLDRRKGYFDRDGLDSDCATQLRCILKGCGSELDSNVRQAISCGREIYQATEEIVSGSEAQSDSVEQTTSFIEKLSSRILSVCDNTETALASSTKAQDSAQNGHHQLQELVEEMKKIRNHAAARERKLQALGQHTKEIETIVQTIGTLSSRTDLLALNASIESVRAGEHGRGFAIVAEEVRALAEQSAQAVLDITRRIEMIQLETHQSITVASGEHDQMLVVIQRVTETLDSLQDICDAAGNSAEGLTEISNATNRQLQLTREIIIALERSTESSKRNRSRAEGANWTARTLGQVGEQLEESLDVFRLSGAIKTATPAPVHATELQANTPALSL